MAARTLFAEGKRGQVSAGGNVAQDAIALGERVGCGNHLRAADVHEKYHRRGSALFGEHAGHGGEHARTLLGAADPRQQGQPEQPRLPQGGDRFLGPGRVLVHVRRMHGQDFAHDLARSGNPNLADHVQSPTFEESERQGHREQELSGPGLTGVLNASGRSMRVASSAAAVHAAKRGISQHTRRMIDPPEGAKSMMSRQEKLKFRRPGAMRACSRWVWGSG